MRISSLLWDFRGIEEQLIQSPALRFQLRPVYIGLYLAMLGSAFRLPHLCIQKEKAPNGCLFFLEQDTGVD